MSSVVFIGGLLDLGRASAVARFRRERLRALPGPVEALGGAPAFESVAGALASTSECGRFVRIALEGARVLVEAAVSDDWQDAWLPTIGSIALAAANVGATGTLVATDESGAFGGRVQVRPGDARFVAVTDRVALARLIDDPLLAGALQRLASERGGEHVATKTTRAAKKASPQKTTKPAATEPTLAEVLGRRPGSAPKFGSVDPDHVSERLADVAEARDASAVPLLLEALAHSSDHTVRSIVADTLLFFDDPRATEAVAAQLDLEHWAGGDLLREAVRAVFKLDPERAFDRLKGFFDEVSKTPEAHSIPGQHILAFVLDDYVPRDPDDPAWREERGVPRRIVERDRRWLDLAASLGHCSFSCLKHLPLHLLEAARDPRLAEVALENVGAIGPEKAIGFVERSAGKQASSLLEAAAARKENAAFRKELLAAAKRSPKKR